MYLEKTVNDIYEILQNLAEPLHSYIAWLNHKNVSIPNVTLDNHICLQGRHVVRRGYVQGADKVQVHDHGWCIVPGLGTCKMGGRFSISGKMNDDQPYQRPGKEAWGRNLGTYHNRPIKSPKERQCQCGWTSPISHSRVQNWSMLWGGWTQRSSGLRTLKIPKHYGTQTGGTNSIKTMVTKQKIISNWRWKSTSY